MKCPLVVSVFVALRQTSLKRADMVTESEMHAADEFIQTVNVDSCVKAGGNAQWLYEDKSMKPELE